MRDDPLVMIAWALAPRSKGQAERAGQKDPASGRTPAWFDHYLLRNFRTYQFAPVKAKSGLNREILDPVPGRTGLYFS
jgi:hypothetical protein